MKEEKTQNPNNEPKEKVETILETGNTRETKERNKKNNNKTRMMLVLLFLVIFAVISYIQLRGSYLEYQELGEQYIQIFYTNLIYEYTIMAVNFVVLYLIMYMTNRGIKKGLTPFFEKENKKIPKLPNKSLSLVISAIVSIVVSAVFMQKIMLGINNTAFGIQDSIFNLDISYYMFIKPIIEIVLIYFVTLVVGLSIYIALYYVIVFNMYFDGIDGKMLKQSLFMKNLIRNVMLIAIGIALITILNTQNIMQGKILTVNEDIDIMGAGITEATIKLWGYVIFAFIIIIFAYRAIKAFKQEKTSKVLKNLAVIPGYLVVLFIAMVGFDLIFVNTNEIDKEKEYIEQNIENTKSAYNINIEERNIENSGTITEEEVDENQNIINNAPIMTQNAVLTTLEDNQTETGYFSYRNANLANYEINGQIQTVYIAPREIKNDDRTYNNKTYEYTHGMGAIIASASQGTETGNVQYVQKEISGSDEKINIEQPRIYFGLETNDIIATNAKNKQEYDYTDQNGTEYTSVYNGKAGLELNFLDRIILGITKGDLKLAFSNEVTDDSKILINRQVITRAKKALPYLIYDENPYTVITDDGRIVWVIDAYTVSSSYPYSQYTTIEHDGIHENINYIRNSVKVLVDSYDGTISYYITDRTDPIAMAYRNIYPTLFVDLEEEIPQDIQEHLVYPKFLYDVQAEVLKVYHNVKPDVLYRADDLWDIAKYNTVKNSRSTGTYMESYYAMIEESGNEELGLIQIYTPDEKQNIISYLIGTVDGSINKLTLQKFSADSNIVGPMQLDKQIEEDVAISTELETLNTTGTKLTKEMIIVPINNTLLYIEPIYQTMLNETEIPQLKKIIVASGNKVAIGNTLTSAIQNLLSQYAVDIEVENTEDIDGLIDAIIKANDNLTQSNNSNNWELMGSDLNRLQELIDSLKKLKKEEDEKQEQLQDEANNQIQNSENNIIKNISTNNQQIQSNVIQ